MLAIAATPHDYQCWGRVIWQLKIGREVAARLRHGQYYGEKGSGSCLSNFFASIDGSRIGIFSVIFIFLRFCSLMSREFKLVRGWKQELMKINMKQTEHPTCLWFDPVQHTLLEPARRSDTAQPCSPIPPWAVPLSIARGRIAPWHSNNFPSLCSSIFTTIPKKSRKPFPLGCQWEAEIIKHTQRLFQGKF